MKSRPGGWSQINCAVAKELAVPPAAKGDDPPWKPRWDAFTVTVSLCVSTLFPPQRT